MKKIDVTKATKKDSHLSANSKFIGFDENGIFQTDKSRVLTSEYRKLEAVEQYALLINDDIIISNAVRIGIPCFITTSGDNSDMGLFNIGRASNGAYTIKTTENSHRLYRVTLNGVKYIAIKKPSSAWRTAAIYVNIYSSGPQAANIFEIVNASELTDIVAL